jgi:osmoprotectant transport system substrate-binding protein
MRKQKLTIVFSILIVAAFLISACGGASETTIRIGSKEFTEQYILGNMYKLLLEDAGYTVEYQPLGGTSENHQALLNDEIDIYPEYTGTGLLTILEETYDPSMTADDVYATVSAGYADQFNLTWGDQTAFNNTYCLTMTQDKANELGVSTLSDLSEKASDLVFGTTQEFTEPPMVCPACKKCTAASSSRKFWDWTPGCCMPVSMRAILT